MIQNVNLLQSFLFILYLLTKTNITWQVYLNNCAYKIADMQMIDNAGDNLLETDGS